MSHLTPLPKDFVAVSPYVAQDSSSQSYRPPSRSSFPREAISPNSEQATCSFHPKQNPTTIGGMNVLDYYANKLFVGSMADKYMLGIFAKTPTNDNIMRKRLDNPRSNYSSIRSKKKTTTGIGYGETLFKVLFFIFLILGFLTSILALFNNEVIVFFAGINSILFSFIFKFMESVILLLKGIKKELKISNEEK